MKYACFFKDGTLLGTHDSSIDYRENVLRRDQIRGFMKGNKRIIFNTDGEEIMNN